MPFDLFAEATDKKPHSAVADFFRAAVHSAVEDPVNGVGQFIDHTLGTHLPKLDIVDEPNDNVWSRAGNILGASIDYLLLSKLTDGVYKNVGLENKIVGAGLTGMLFEFTRPVDESTGQNYWSMKAKNETAAFATFATMQAADQILEKNFKFFGKPGTRTFFQDVALGGLSAAPGGVVDTEMHSLLDGKGLTTKDLAQNVASYGLFGAFANGVSHGIGKFADVVKHQQPVEGQDLPADWMKNVQFDLLGKKVEPWKGRFLKDEPAPRLREGPVGDPVGREPMRFSPSRIRPASGGAEDDTPLFRWGLPSIVTVGQPA